MTMEFPAAAFDPALLTLMSRAYDDTCSDDAVKHLGAPIEAAQTMMALRIMTAVAAGERSIDRLKLLALQAIDNRRMDHAA